MVKELRDGISGDYDLGGFDNQQLGQLVSGAFSEAIPATEMLRFVFVVANWLLNSDRLTDAVCRLVAEKKSARNITPICRLNLVAI